MALQYSRNVGQGALGNQATGLRPGNGTDNPAAREPGMLLNLRNSLEALESRVTELLHQMELLGDRIHGGADHGSGSKLNEPMGERPRGPVVQELNDASGRLHLLLGKMKDQFDRLDRL